VEEKCFKHSIWYFSLTTARIIDIYLLKFRFKRNKKGSPGTCLKWSEIWKWISMLFAHGAAKTSAGKNFSQMTCRINTVFLIPYAATAEINLWTSLKRPSGLRPGGMASLDDLFLTLMRSPFAIPFSQILAP
jgi:hypothetical protein